MSIGLQSAVTRVNREAARSTSAWLMGLGLADAILAVARHASDVPIPTPGLEKWRNDLDDAAADASRIADLVLSVANGDSDLPLADVEHQVDRCALRASRTEATSRALAQLALGVTSHAFATDEVMRLERASVVVLAEATRGAANDDHVMLGIDEQEVRVEVAGLLARILTEGELAAVWHSEIDGESVEAFVGNDADLSAWFPEGPMRRWTAPLRVTESAREIAEHVCGWSSPLCQIRVEVSAVR